MKIVIGGDSAGKVLADLLVKHVAKNPAFEVIDVSTQPQDKEFYADLSERAALQILSGEADRGILVCGTGIGVCISANKVAGIRAALTHDTYSAERAAKSNNAHIITMGARVIGPELAKSIVDTWLASEFDPASSSGPNVEAIDRLATRYGKAS